MYWDQAISPTRERGIPWATLFGNHDDASFVWPLEWFSAVGLPEVHCSQENICSGEKGCSFRGTTRIELMNMEIKTNSLSYSQCGPPDLWPGVSNYILQISSSEDLESPSVFLYFLDSGGGSYPEVISYSQVKWFQEKSQEMNPHARVPELVFWHIPSRAYKKIAPSPKSPIKFPCVGSMNFEEVASQEAEWGIMDALLNRSSVKDNVWIDHLERRICCKLIAVHAGLEKSKNVVEQLKILKAKDTSIPKIEYLSGRHNVLDIPQAVFAGHNHGLDWCCPYNKVWLCFARHSGYGGYGSWPRGARTIEMTEYPFSLNSWIRMEDGSTHSYISLSS